MNVLSTALDVIKYVLTQLEVEIAAVMLDFTSATTTEHVLVNKNMTDIQIIFSHSRYQ